MAVRSLDSSFGPGFDSPHLHICHVSNEEFGWSVSVLRTPRGSH